MYKSVNLMKTSIGLLLLFSLTTSSFAASLGIGTTASTEEIAGWDIDVRPDGVGLPAGSGSVLDGEPLYEEKCASCHGVFGEGEGGWPVLAGGEGTLTEARPEKTVGSYWPYLSTLWDYIHRAMPFLTPQTLEDDEVYAITAYILYLNELVEDDFVLSQENFTSVKMPNEMSFVDDPRPDVHNKRCMNKCKDPTSIELDWQSPGLGLTSTKPTAEPVEQTENKPSAAPAEVDRSSAMGRDTYASACAVCHASGIAGAPAVGDNSIWQARIQQGLVALNEHALQGYQGDWGFMPAKGGNPSLSDESVKAAVEYMVEQSK
jgi:cytochrome c